MAKWNYLYQWLFRTKDERLILDKNVKEFLSAKDILAWILKCSVQEFKDFEIHEIMNFIEGEIDIGKIPLEPGLTNLANLFRRQEGERITGMPTEDRIPFEGIVFFDIRFYVRYPSSGELAKMIINVEAQSEFTKSIVKRGIVYCARMLSSQIRREFKPPHYEKAKKVVSIWICFNPPAYAEDSIISYKMEQNNIYGNMRRDRLPYDLLEVVLVCLKTEVKEDSTNKLIKMLNTVLNEEKTLIEKTDMLESEYGIVADDKMKEVIQKMCNYSDYVLERGIEKGIEKGIERGFERGREQVLIALVHDGEISVESAAKRLGKTVTEFEQLMK